MRPESQFKGADFLEWPTRKAARVLWPEITALSGEPNQPLTVAKSQTGEFAGQCGFLISDSRPHEPELYCVLRQKFWRKGLAQELCSAMLHIAFQKLGATRVVGLVHPENSASITLVERLGFVKHSVHSSIASWQHGHLVYSRTP